MANNTCTDVPESISGYYYQILLAIRELFKLVDDNDGVGIEKGADIRLFKRLEKNYSIEAKFYSKDFDRNSEPITHTIYNFYNNCLDDESLIFETNVKINDSLLNEISDVTDSNKITEDQIQYVCYCIMKESLGVTIGKGDGEYKVGDKFKEFLKNSEIDFKKYITQKHYNYYYKQFDESNTIKFFGIDINKSKVKLLIVKIRFKAGREETKAKSIGQLKNDIKSNFINFDLDSLHYDEVIKYIVDKFLETTIENNQLQVITLGDLKKELQNIKENDYELNLKFYNGEFIRKLEELDEKVFNQIEDSYEGDYKEELFKRYVFMREKAFGEIRKRNYDQIEDALRDYSLSDSTINTFDQLVKFTSILTLFDNIDYEKVEFIEDKFVNLIIDNDKLLYKEHDPLSSKAVLNSFIRETIDSISRNNDDATIVFAGKMNNDKSPCKTKISNDHIYKITQVDENRQLVKYYKSLKYKCSECIYIYDDDIEAKEKIDKFKQCGGWKSWN